MADETKIADHDYVDCESGSDCHHTDGRYLCRLPRASHTDGSLSLVEEVAGQVSLAKDKYSVLLDEEVGRER